MRSQTPIRSIFGASDAIAVYAYLQAKAFTVPHESFILDDVGHFPIRNGLARSMNCDGPALQRTPAAANDMTASGPDE